jgi:tetratricopeptide (TPR) repeat protein
MKNTILNFYAFTLIIVLSSCNAGKENKQLVADLQSVDLLRGDIALCVSDKAQFGKVNFAMSCDEKVRDNFGLAIALLHSFEYTEAEKAFAKVIDADPDCLMAYWGAAMSNFHPLWFPPTKDELAKGAKIVAIGRSFDNKAEREADYLEAIGAFYDNWDKLDHRQRVLNFEEATRKIYEKYPTDTEAAVFYALALRASSEPTDKTFAKQRKAGEILNTLFSVESEHPGVAHYLIHVYDYPELAELALPAARKYASIAASSAHALHMPSHIFTRVGSWNEAVESNTNSIAAAKCYAENSGMASAWDEELHAIDYLVYAYLQQGRDSAAKAELSYIRALKSTTPMNGKSAYTFAAVPTRCALERKDWKEASELQFLPDHLNWDDFPWERSVLSFGKVLAGVHTKKTDVALKALEELKQNHSALVAKNKTYEANQVMIQITASEAWIKFLKGEKAAALALMTKAADMEDATDKHPVTPGEVVPARELLGDMYMEFGDFKNALNHYEKDLERHAGRYNALYGAGLSAFKSGDTKKGLGYFEALRKMSQPGENQRPSLQFAESVLNKNI